MHHRGRPRTRWLMVCVAGLLAACSATGEKKGTSDAAGLYPILPQAELARLSPEDQIRYFTDNVYLASTHRDGGRAEVADVTWRYLKDTLSKEDFVQFWTGVDNEFFARVNAVLEYPDYTVRQVPLDQRRMRTAYNLGARHLAALKGLAEARREAMQDLIDLAAKGHGAACFAFHKAYKDYPKPRSGANLTWSQVSGTPFRKSMWAGSAEAVVDGRVVQIPVPAEVVLGCRSLFQPPATVAAGLVDEVEQFFGGIQLKAGFDAAGYAERKAAWQREITQRALAAGQRLRLDRIRIVNVVDVYQIFPPALDYEYELAATDGGLAEVVAAGILNEQDAFVVEQRVAERKTLLTGVGVTPQDTPMAFLKMVEERAGPK